MFTPRGSRQSCGHGKVRRLITHGPRLSASTQLLFSNPRPVESRFPSQLNWSLGYCLLSPSHQTESRLERHRPIDLYDPQPFKSRPRVTQRSLLYFESPPVKLDLPLPSKSSLANAWAMSDPQEQPWSDNPNAPNISRRLYFDEKAYFAGLLISSVLYGTPEAPATLPMRPCSFRSFGLF